MWRRLFRRDTPLLPSEVAYAWWAKTYPPSAHNPFMQEEQAAMLELLPETLHDDVVLDLACGTGRWGNIAASRGAAQVISIDESLPMLIEGQPTWAVGGGLTEIPLASGTVDTIICGLAVGHVVREHLWAALSEMKRVLRPNGIALISDLHPVRAWMGAQRTFRHGEKRYAVEHYIHGYADYHAATGRLGLNIEAVREVPRMTGEPPAVLVIKLRRS